jgi:hypothetical protein
MSFTLRQTLRPTIAHIMRPHLRAPTHGNMVFPMSEPWTSISSTKCRFSSSWDGAKIQADVQDRAETRYGVFTCRSSLLMAASLSVFSLWKIISVERICPTMHLRMVLKVP